MSDLIKKEGSSISEVKKVHDNLYNELSEHPKPNAIKVNPFANNSKYLDIGYIEAQLDRMFLSWDWEVNDIKNLFNGITVFGKLTVYTIAGHKIIRSGVAGVELQMKKNATNMNPDNIASKAMDRDPGRAEAYALKNAASKLGNLFGRNLNRDYNFEHIPNEELTKKVYGEE